MGALPALPLCLRFCPVPLQTPSLTLWMRDWSLSETAVFSLVSSPPRTQSPRDCPDGYLPSKWVSEREREHQRISTSSLTLFSKHFVGTSSMPDLEPAPGTVIAQPQKTTLQFSKCFCCLSVSSLVPVSTFHSWKLRLSEIGSNHSQLCHSQD